MAAEGVPFIPENPEDAAEKSSGETDKKKKRQRRGHLAVVHEAKPPEPEKSEKPREDKAENWLGLGDDKESGAKAEKPALAEAEPVNENEAPLEELGEAEIKTIVQETAQASLEASPGPDAEGDPEVAAAELAAQDFLAAAAETGDIEAALATTAAKLEVDPEDWAEFAPEETETEDSEPGLEETPETPDEELVFDRRAEAKMPEEEPEPEEPASTGGSTAGATPPPPAPPAGGGPGGSRRPPFGPFGPGGPPVPGGFNPNFNQAPAAAAPNRPNYEHLDDGANPAVMALAGGIIGYLIGRRRGRIKTEKKLLPIQKKLEKQVTNLQFELQQKEKQVRRVAAEKVRQQGPAVIEVFRAETPEKPGQEPRRKAPEANLLHIPQAPEHIGHMLMTAESKPAAAAEKQPEARASKAEGAPERAAKPLTDRRIETMNRRELLEISEKIVVEGSTLRQIYETHLIGERGLRRLVAEHLRGGDLKKALRAEIVEREIDFERDPAMRDMAPDSTGQATGGGSGGRATLDQLVAKAAGQVGQDSEEAAYFKARAAYDAKQYEQQQKQQRIIDISLTVVILSLLSIVVWLAFTRG